MSHLSDAYRALTSKTAQRTLLYTVLLSATSAVLYAIAIVGYLGFYHEYIPHQVRSTPVHLQYGPAFAQFASITGTAAGAAAAAASNFKASSASLFQHLHGGYHHPFALADLRNLDLKTDQDYDIAVVLSLPHSPANLAVGNFMVELVLASAGTGSASRGATDPITAAARLPPANPREFLESGGKRVVFAAARPALLAYTDPLVAQAKRFALLPLHFFAPEAASRSRMIVPMAESLSFAETSSAKTVLPAVMYMEVRATGSGGGGAHELQTYGAEVVFSARLRGLRWLMYHHRVFSFLLLTTAWWLVEVAFMMGVFVAVGVAFSGSDGNGNGTGPAKSGWETNSGTSTPSVLSPPPRAASRIKKEEEADRGAQGSKRTGRPLSGALASPKSPATDIKKEKQDDQSGGASFRLASVPAAPAAASPTASKPAAAKTAKVADTDAKAAKRSGSSGSRRGIVDDPSEEADEDDVNVEDDDFDDYDDASDYGSGENPTGEDDEEPLSSTPSRKQGKSAVPPLSPKAVATGRSSTGSADNPLRQRTGPRDQQQQHQPTPEKEASRLSTASSASTGKESPRKKTVQPQEQKQSRPP